MTGRSDTRRWGLLLVGAVLLAAAVVPDLGARTVPGTASAGPLGGPPSAGDCVSDPIDPSWAEPYLYASPSGMKAKYIYPQVGLGPCRGSRYGEVTVVIPDPAHPKITNSADSGTRVNDPNLVVCSLAAYRYVGGETTGSTLAPLVGPWFRSQFITAAASTPSVRQQAAGQHWLACVVYFEASVGDPQAYGDQERYAGVLRDAFTTGQERNRLGTCSTGGDLTDQQGGCGMTHNGETFASGLNGDKAASRSQLQSSCDRVVALSTGIPDVTTVGFTIQMVADDGNVVVPATEASIPPGASLSCGVTADGGRTLNGSLLALGNAPIPWT